MPAQAIFPYVPQSTHRQSRNGCSTIRIMSCWFGSWNFQLRRQCHTPEDLSERYDSLAESWEDTLGKFETAGAYRIVLSRALPTEMIVEPNAKPRVLDCGTGTGAFLSAFADASRGQPELHGVDISPAMLEQAREMITQRGHEAQFRLGELTQLPYPDAHFDVVLAAHVVEHIADPQAALEEMRRVLKPGGLMVLCVTRQSLMGRAIQFRWRIHTVTEASAKDWLTRAGMTAIHPLRALSVGRFDSMSIACAARKPRAQLKNVKTKDMEVADV